MAETTDKPVVDPVKMPKMKMSSSALAKMNAWAIAGATFFGFCAIFVVGVDVKAGVAGRGVERFCHFQTVKNNQPVGNGASKNDGICFSGKRVRQMRVGVCSFVSRLVVCYSPNVNRCAFALS